MVEIKLTLANDDLAPMLDWVEDTESDLVEAMIASQPTKETSQATLVFSVLERIRVQIKTFQLELAAKEAAARR